MADYGKLLACVDRILNSRGLDRYLAMQQALAADTLSADPFVSAVAAELAGIAFQGSSAELLKRLPRQDKPSAGWPADARAVTARLHRMAPAMRKTGWQI